MNHRLFISHSWSYSGQYFRLIQLLNAQGYYFYNHSVPIDDPIHTNGTIYQLRNAIDAQIKGASCVIILAGVYSTHSRWINEEIQIALSYGKPIIAVEPWASERTSAVVKNCADMIVKWQASSIIHAIHQLC
jgi:hypothetical protein